MMKFLSTWIKNNKAECLFLLAILLVGAFLRLYRIGEFMTFLGDEGRDAIVVRRLLVYGDPILIGPGTSIGNMYLGPLYYYLIAPALFLANFSPVGPSVLVALMSVVTIALVYFIGKEWFGKLAGFVAAALYTVSPTVIIFSRSSWNPNVMPFFALLSIYAIWRTWQKKEYKWLIPLGVSYAFVMQSHYLGLVLAPVLGLFWLMAFWEGRKEKALKGFWKNTFIGLALFLFLMSPLVIFDARHGWNNFGAIKTFFTERQTTVSIKPWKAIPNLWPIYELYITRLLGGRNEIAGRYTSVILLSLLAFFVGVKWKKLTQIRKRAYLLTLAWLLAASVGLGLYKQHIYDHYYGFFFAAPFLILGAMFESIWESEKSKLLRAIPVVGVVLLLGVNLWDLPIKGSPNRQLQRSQEVARKVIEVSQGEKFNFALIAERNYEAGYRYYLDLWNAKVVDIDPQNTQGTITDQLLVVCEMEKEKCDPTHNAKAEVAAFGWSKIGEEWLVSGITLYKLEHTQ